MGKLIQEKLGESIGTLIEDLIGVPVGIENSNELIKNNDISNVVAPSFNKRIKRVATPQNLMAAGFIAATAAVSYFLPEVQDKAQEWFDKNVPSLSSHIPILIYNVGFHIATALTAFYISKKVKKQKISKEDLKENLKYQGIWGPFRHGVYHYGLPFVKRVGGWPLEQAVYFCHFWLYSLGYIYSTNRKKGKSFKQTWKEFKEAAVENRFIYLAHAANVGLLPVDELRAMVGSLLTMLYTINTAMVSYKHGNLRTHLSGKIDLKSMTPKDFLRVVYNEDKSLKEKYKTFDDFEFERRSLVKDSCKKEMKKTEVIDALGLYLTGKHSNVFNNLVLK